MILSHHLITLFSNRKNTNKTKMFKNTAKLKSSIPKSLATTSSSKDPKFIRYTPSSSSTGIHGANNNETRIIRMIEAPVDPMEPPKFKHKKVPRPPPSPPVPVLHSPPRKLTAEEQADFVIPPCVSNWKNLKGYTIPLHQRLAADGRGIQDVSFYVCLIWFR